MVFFLPEYLWIDDDRLAHVLQDDDDSASNPSPSRRTSRHPTPSGNVHVVQANIDAIEREDSVGSFTPGNVQLKLSEEDEVESGAKPKVGKKKLFRGGFGRFRRLPEHRDHDEIEEDHAIVPHIMTDHEIMHKYWKLAVRETFET